MSAVAAPQPKCPCESVCVNEERHTKIHLLVLDAKYSIRPSSCIACAKKIVKILQPEEDIATGKQLSPKRESF